MEESQYSDVQLAEKKVSGNAIVVMMDSLQFNYLGCYGNDWIKTPNIDRFAREGVVFENAYCEGLPTVPCRRAMHTGRFTLHAKGWSPLDPDDTTIADLTWGQGIDTALIFDCPMYRLPKFGYTRGFDKVWFIHGHEGDHYYYSKDPLIHYKAEDFHEDHVIESANETHGEDLIGPLMHETESYLKQRQYWKSEEDQSVAQVMKSAVDYLEKVDRNKPFFLWIDSFDPHEPWDSPSVYDPEMSCPYNPDYEGKDQFLPLMAPVEGVYTEEELHHVRMLYAENVTMCDTWFGYLMDNVKRLGLEKDTLVMLVSDHGEPMGNGEHGHGIMRKCRPWPYEELAHIVFIVRGPGLPAGKRVEGFVQSSDVAPTVTEWLGLGIHAEMQGDSVLPMARGEVDKIRDWAIAGYHKYSWSLITEDYSFIHWLKDEEKSVSGMHRQIYGVETEKSAMHLAMGERGSDQAEMMLNEVQKMHAEAATLDGEDQWTCTPGAVSEVPERDELYDRKTDQFQLNNIVGDNPEVAKKMLEQLKEIMAELATT
jgi:arylsulfatase A-like enzyme